MKTPTSRLLVGTALVTLATGLLIGCNKAPEGSPAASNAATTVGTTIDDSAVTGRVKASLLADADIKSFDISVRTVKGEVLLTGFVNNQSQIDQATQIARATEGATGVKNELRVKPG